MSLEALAAPLMRVELFRDLSPQQLSGIARAAERITFRPGDTIAQAGREGDAAILIVAGDAVRVEGPGLDGSEDRIEAGSLIGEMAMLIEHTYGSTVVAVGPVRALRITRSAVLAQMEADPTLAEHFVACITERLHDIATELRRIDRSLDAPVLRASIVPWRETAHAGSGRPAEASPAAP